ncbi:unnamed protein product [Caenorhabditis angaria]|uniref:WASH complex subunit 4 n=1 Tax=Caenorhabditis angaria TaxID=860376 RepID=A0A9P1ICI0_9PELO|nr:unnamed protein product [Caenorhabditis angaria]
MDPNSVKPQITRLQKFRESILQQIPSIECPRNFRKVVYEDESLNKLDITTEIHSDHEMVGGCLRILSSMLHRGHIFVRRANEIHFPKLLMYAHTASGAVGNLELCLDIAVSSCEIFINILDFHQEIFTLFRNIVVQMYTFRNQSVEEFPIGQTIQFKRVWRCLGDLLGIVIQLDEIVLAKPIIRQNHQIMLRDIEERIERMAGNDNVKLESLQALQETYMKLKLAESYCLSGNAFREFYEESLGELDTSIGFAKEMHLSIHLMYLKWEKASIDNRPDRRQFMAILGLSVYYHHHFANFANKELIRKVLGGQRKLGAFSLFGDLRFFPGAFLLREIADHSVFDKKDIAAVEKTREDLNIPNIFDAIQNDIIGRIREVENWEEEVERKIEERMNNRGNIAQICLDLGELFLKGVSIADLLQGQSKILLSKFVGVGGNLESMLLTRDQAFRLLDGLETIKSISFVFQKHWRVFSESAMLAVQQWKCHAINFIEKAKVVLKASQLPPGEIECKNASLSVARDMLFATPNKQRMLICATALDIGDIEKWLKTQDLAQLHNLINRIDNFLAPRTIAEKTTNCAFLAHSYTLNDVFWEHIFTRKSRCENIRRWLSIVTDVENYWNIARNELNYSEPNSYHIIRYKFLSKLCSLVENDLRISTHQHLEISKRDCLSEEDSKLIRHLLQSGVFRFSDQIIDCREFVTRYLEKAFYNLTVVAPHDAQTYAKMAKFASLKYDLEIISGGLPNGGIDESTDMIELVKNLSSVVVNYNYSMTQELFIEKQSPNRRLHVFTRNDLVNALRKFGNGLVPTATNIAYQILRKKLNIFYQFLSDDHIRAQIEFDMRLIENSPKMSTGMERGYTYDMCENFTNKMVKIAASEPNQTNSGGSERGTEDGEEKAITYLDKFRVLITQIGNTLGFVRTIGMASKNVEVEMGEYMSTEITRLLDELDVGEEQHETIQRIRNRCRVGTSSVQKSDFNQLLVNVFKDALNKNLSYLTNFYMIIPALSWSYADYMRICRIRAKNSIHTQQNDYTTVNDGFVVGIAYLLTVLNGWEKFEELIWFDEIMGYLDNETIRLIANPSKGSKLKQERCEALHGEFQEIKESLYSAKIFFEFEDFGVKTNEKDEEQEDDWF